MSREELAEAIADDPRLIPLVTRLLYAAGMTGQDETLKLLGTAFGDAVRQRDHIDETEMILSALSDLRKHHVEILQLLATPAPPPPDAEAEGAHGAWWPALLGERSGMREEFVILCLAGLTNAGLVRTRNTYGGPSYEPTEIGLNILDVLTQLSVENHNTAAEKA
jgi:hypothetical protein